ncbi:hypothetical protein HW452_16780 [Halomonas aquamarina]|uniref:Uncharacterized protein n=1 Tax=Vreelandella aquamarina TaxID=77097 RepID=A0ACC5VZP8_9GAMM|nr:helix-turn-helix domain-containing protein [Halomonas aquamarina]MBZ5489177.1 hypothetical protein [Halomonas aquamarina]
MFKPVYVTDPANGERVSMSELASRYNISLSALSRRHAQGKRGAELVGELYGRDRLEEQKAIARAAAERRQALINASSRALTRPFKHIASASQVLGGNHHV